MDKKNDKTNTNTKTNVKGTQGDMKRTEFAEEYNLDTDKQEKKNDKTNSKNSCRKN